MPYKTRRQNRYARLREIGFTGFEARALSHVSPQVPYLLPMMKERLVEYSRAIKQAKRQGIAETDFNKRWETHIKKRYVAKDWKHRSDVWGVTVAYRMLKAAERIYKYKHPEYDSPWEKRQKDWRDFVAKIDKSYEKYPRSYGRKQKIKPEPVGEVVFNPETGKYEPKLYE